MAKKVTVLKKYLDYANIFLKKSAAKQLKHLNINKLTINLEVIFFKFLVENLPIIKKMQIIGQNQFIAII